jgi:DNA-binding response OmpR family regulator
MVKKILVIEDDPDVSSVLELLFDTPDFEAHFFRFPKKAIEFAEDIMPDLIITDLMMSGMTGFEICTYFKNNEKMKNVPIIAITGYDSHENRRKIFTSGIDDYLPKPFEVKILLKKIQNLLKSDRRMQ